MNEFGKFSRRTVNKQLLTLLGGALAAPWLSLRNVRAQAGGESLRIGIIGSGRMGGAVGLEWAEAGHQVLFSSRNPDELTDLVEQAGNGARAGFPEEAAEFGEVVLIAVPYAALPQVGEDYAPLMEGKVVIDLCNPVEDRDGPMAAEVLEMGVGMASRQYLPGVRLVRALNAVSFIMVQNEGVRDDGQRIGVPIAGNDDEAVAVTSRLVRDIGFEPVVVGGLSRAREFQPGTDVYVRGMTAGELREALDLTG